MNEAHVCTAHGILDCETYFRVVLQTLLLMLVPIVRLTAACIYRRCERMDNLFAKLTTRYVLHSPMASPPTPPSFAPHAHNSVRITATRTRKKKAAPWSRRRQTQMATPYGTGLYRTPAGVPSSTGPYARPVGASSSTGSYRSPADAPLPPGTLVPTRDATTFRVLFVFGGFMHCAPSQSARLQSTPSSAGKGILDDRNISITRASPLLSPCVEVKRCARVGSIDTVPPHLCQWAPLSYDSQHRP